MKEQQLCDYCDTPIRERYWYVINGDTICRQCLHENFRREAQDGVDDGDEDE